jgi:uncharacterized protein HemX
MEPILKGNPGTGEVKAEIQQDIAVKQPINDIAPAKPVQPVSNPMTGATTNNAQKVNEDAELDKILTDVKSQINSPQPEADPPKAPTAVEKSVNQLQKVKPAIKDVSKRPKPKLAIAIAIVVVLALAGAAAYSFKQNQNQEKITKAHQASVEHAKAQAANNQPQSDTFNADYLTSFSNSLSSDQSQDFDDSPLSDSSLGL